MQPIFVSGKAFVSIQVPHLLAWVQDWHSPKQDKQVPATDKELVL
jgi:hypothetical protein